nr:hypothetical protein [uncultured Draconibacterium sp.]
MNGFAQFPDFIERLNGGTVQSEDFIDTVKFRLKDDRIYVNSLINGESFDLLIDTYSPCLLFDYILDEISVGTLDRTSSMGKAFETTFLKPIYPKLDSIQLGATSFIGIGAILMKSDITNPLLKYPIDGILGSNLMNKCIWQFNFSDTILTLANKEEYLNSTSGGISFPFKPKPVQGSPNTILVINGDTIQAEFDTGNNGFINAISPSIRKKIADGEAVPWSVKLSIPINRDDSDSIETHFYVLIDSLEIGNKIYYNLPIISYNPELIKQESKGSIGLGFIKNYSTTIDWLENKIYLDEDETFESKAG